MMCSGAGDEGGEAGAAVMSANSLSFIGVPTSRSQLSVLRHQRNQCQGSCGVWKRSDCPNHGAQVRCSTKFRSSRSGLSDLPGEGTVLWKWQWLSTQALILRIRLAWIPYPSSPAHFSSFCPILQHRGSNSEDKKLTGDLGPGACQAHGVLGCHELGRLRMAETSGSCETMSKRIWTSFRSWKQVMVPRSEKGVSSQGL